MLRTKRTLLDEFYGFSNFERLKNKFPSSDFYEIFKVSIIDSKAKLLSKFFDKIKKD